MKLISLLLLLLLLMIQIVNAEGKTNSLTERIKEAVTSQGAQVDEAEKDIIKPDWLPEEPSSFSYAYDYTYQTLSDEQILEIIKKGEYLSTKTGAQVIVLAVKSFGTEGSNFTTGVINKWGIGSKERNDGVLIALAVDDRMIHIGTGSGIDTVLTEHILDEILDKNLHYFIADNYGEGLISVYQDISDFLIAFYDLNSIDNCDETKRVFKYANFSIYAPEGWTFEDPKDDMESRVMLNGEEGWYLGRPRCMPLKRFCEINGLDYSSNPRNIIDEYSLRFDNGKIGANQNQAWYIKTIFSEKAKIARVVLVTQTAALILQFSDQAASTVIKNAPSYTGGISLLNEMCEKIEQDAKPLYYSLWEAFPGDDYEISCKKIVNKTGVRVVSSSTEFNRLYKDVLLWGEKYDLLISKSREQPVLDGIIANRQIDFNETNFQIIVKNTIENLETEFGTCTGSIMYGQRTNGFDYDGFSAYLNKNGKIDLDCISNFINRYNNTFWMIRIYWGNISLKVSGSKQNNFDLSITENGDFFSYYPYPQYFSGKVCQ